MNKDKVIKDLKKQNDKLKNQYQLLEIRHISLEMENQRLKDKIEKINKIFEDGCFEDGCDCIKIYDEIILERKGEN